MENVYWTIIFFTEKHIFLFIRCKGRGLGFDKQKINLVLPNLPPSVAWRSGLLMYIFLRTYSKENTFDVFPPS